MEGRSIVSSRDQMSGFINIPDMLSVLIKT